MANLTPFSRKKWRRRGYHVETTEFFHQVAGGLPRRRDLFGFADLVAIDLTSNQPWVFVQVTSWGNVSARKRKIQEGTTGKGQWELPMRDIASAIIRRGDRVLIEGWKKDKAGKHGPRGHYVEREVWITGEDLT